MFFFFLLATRSPDLTSPDFFLWGYLKDRVFSTSPESIADLENHIAEEINGIPKAMLVSVFTNMIKRIKLCKKINGNLNP